MGARQQLADAIDAEVGYVVVSDLRRIDRIEGPVVQVTRRTVAKSDRAPRGQLETEFDVVVIVPYQDSAGGEDELDDATDAVLEVLERLQWVAWEKAERSTYNDTYISYRIPVTAFTSVETTNG